MTAETHTGLPPLTRQCLVEACNRLSMCMPGEAAYVAELLESAETTARLGGPDFDISVALYRARLLHGDTTEQRVSDVALRAAEVENGYRVDDHDGPYAFAVVTGDGSPTCTAIHTDLLDDALRELLALLGDQAVQRLAAVAA